MFGSMTAESSATHGVEADRGPHKVDGGRSEGAGRRCGLQEVR